MEKTSDNTKEMVVNINYRDLWIIGGGIKLECDCMIGRKPTDNLTMYQLGQLLQEIPEHGKFRLIFEVSND